MSMNPFEWHGPAYLVFYSVSMLFSGSIAYSVKQKFLGKGAGDDVTSANEASALARNLTAYEAACLEGGVERVFVTACSTLARHEIIAINQANRTLEPGENIARENLQLQDVEKVLVARIRGGEISVESAKAVVEPEVRILKSHLQKQELMPTEDSLAQARALPFLIMLVTATTLCLPKVMIGASLHKPVSLLLFELVIGLIISAFFLRQSHEVTGKGRAVVQSLEDGGSALKLTMDSRKDLSLTDTAFAYALYGSALLMTDPFMQASKAVLRPPSTGSGCGSGSGCGGGGCGGGGCGGGCGGCGG